MATRRPTSLPTGSPTTAPTSSPSIYVPVEPPAEIGNLLDPSSLSLHVILIMVSLILACIFVAYLSLHLARKYHPEWFRPGKRRKRKKTKDKNKALQQATSKKEEKKSTNEQKSESKKIVKKQKLMSVKPITTDEENKLKETTPLEIPLSPPGKSISSIVPVQDPKLRKVERNVTEVEEEIREVEGTSPSGKRRVLEVPDFLKESRSATGSNKAKPPGQGDEPEVNKKDIDTDIMEKGGVAKSEADSVTQDPTSPDGEENPAAQLEQSSEVLPSDIETGEAKLANNVVKNV